MLPCNLLVYTANTLAHYNGIELKRDSERQNQL
jgi:hypothetical protein